MKIIASVFLLLCFSLAARDVPNRPTPIVDQAGLLSAKVKHSLEKALYQIQKQTGNEIAVFTIKSLEDETIESYSLKITDKWKLGNKEKDNGVLFLIAVDDRKMRIEVGQGLEGNLPDVTAGRIIRSIQPYFRKGDYQSGIILGISQIVEKTGGKLTNAPRVRNQRSNSGFGFLLFIGFMILSVFSGRGGGRGGRGGGLLTGLAVGAALGGRGSSGGFGGGGSFGGGGGFSGGGASGGW